ncbi:hypothetical protein AV530_003570 [Patagioenas fasciata monilis]|uniref:Uncharacterized protein n=1 Tax=Patagioenas fasciata monilis TaxID=372326 RepID=A0A1V4KXY9_PATFA|nr:hypothetical protein AV530_003570 [Patagioenas fasciata monilis]
MWTEDFGSKFKSGFLEVTKSSSRRRSSPFKNELCAWALPPPRSSGKAPAPRRPRTTSPARPGPGWLSTVAEQSDSPVKSPERHHAARRDGAEAFRAFHKGLAEERRRKTLFCFPRRAHSRLLSPLYNTELLLGNTPFSLKAEALTKTNPFISGPHAPLLEISTKTPARPRTARPAGPQRRWTRAAALTSLLLISNPAQLTRILAALVTTSQALKSIASP